MKSDSCAVLVVMVAVSAAVAQPLQTIHYQESMEDFTNPERGFLHFRTLTTPSGFHTVRQQNHSLIYGRIPAHDFRNGPLSQSFLDQIQAGFDAARANGIKVKPRVVYNDGPNNGGGADAPKSVILGHIQQLQPLFEANKDVVYVMDAGFIGLWGEWHGSTNGLDNNTDRTEILSALLDALPVDRMVGVRTPHYKRQIFNGSPIDATLKITAENAFDGSHLTRVGHHNDCFLGSATDVGTYIYQVAGWTRAAELAYIGGESRYAPHGGETCGQSAYSTGVNAIFEMEQLHTDYLNIDWHPDVLQDWMNEGKFDEISRRLGYRYVMHSAELPVAVRPSGLMELRLELENVGFGELFNPRTMEVTLKNNATGALETAALVTDPRSWIGGTQNTLHTYLSIPANMPEGEYTVGLWMPDQEDSIQNDIRYAVRFANVGVWDDAAGINVLKSDLQISQTAEGPVYPNFSTFEEISDLGQLQPTTDADFDRDGDVDAADINALVAELARQGHGLLFDLTGDGLVDSSDLDRWLADAGRANLPTGDPYLAGDANLDGVVDGTDFNAWNAHKFASLAQWTAGDFNADGMVDGSDFNRWNSNKFQTADLLVPETLSWIFIGDYR